MPQHNGEGKHGAVSELADDLIFVFQKLRLRLEYKLFTGLPDQTDIAGSVLNQAQCMIDAKRFRRGRFVLNAHALKGMSEREYGAAGCIQIALAVGLVLPPAVALTVYFFRRCLPVLNGERGAQCLLLPAL